MGGILGADVVWDCGEASGVGSVGRQAGLGSLGRGGRGGLRGLPRVAILDGGLGRRWKAGVGFAFCLLLNSPIRA